MGIRRLRRFRRLGPPWALVLRGTLSRLLSFVDHKNMAEVDLQPQKDPRTHAIIGAAMEVHRRLGCGFLEAVYQEALAIEFEEKGVPFRREVEMPISYKGRRLRTEYRADFVCFDAVIVEVKALARCGGAEEAQIINYLRATGKEVGLLLNFGAVSLDYKRFASSKSAKSA